MLFRSEASVADRPASPEVDVDIGGTPEPEVGGRDSARDGESDEIVRQLEKGLPRWEGFADVGWAEDLSPVSFSGARPSYLASPGPQADL